MLQELIGVILALSLTTLEAKDADTKDDDIAEFLAVVTNIVSGNELSSGSPDASDEPYSVDLSNSYKRHLGLGFVHGTGNLRADQCHSNGHRQDNGTGQENHDYGIGYGHRDCGDPSPSE